MTVPIRQVVKAKSLELAEALGAQIARNSIPATAQLPPERELAEEHQTSRVTVREGIAKLVEWGLLQVRRGSGAVVRDRRSWSFAALPLAIRAATETATLQRLIRDLLALRRELALHGTRRACGRVGPGDLAAARAAVTLAHANRSRTREFVVADIEMMRSVLVAAELWPQLWLINDLTQSYLDLVADTWPAPTIPADYLETHFAYFDAIESGDTERALALIGDYLTRLDTGLFASLGMSWEEA